MNQFWCTPALLGPWWSCWLKFSSIFFFGKDFSSILGVHLGEMIHLRAWPWMYVPRPLTMQEDESITIEGLSPVTLHTVYVTSWLFGVCKYFFQLCLMLWVYFIYLFRASIYACTPHSSGLSRTNNLSWVTHIVWNHCINHIRLLWIYLNIDSFCRGL